MRKQRGEKGGGEKNARNAADLKLRESEGQDYCPPRTARHGVRKARLPSIREKCWLKYIFGSATAHKFQGREHDVIIMSTVLDSSWSAEKGGGFVDEACLVNVGVSRARKQFVLVTDNELFQKNGHHVHELLRYIQYNTLDEHIINSQIVSVFDLLYKNYSNKLDTLKSKLLYRSRFMSENIIFTALKEILQEPNYSHYDIAEQVMLRNIIRETSRLDTREADFVNNGASIDFVIYNKQDKKCTLIIDVDGFEYHENNPEQLKRDAVKNSIPDKYAIHLLRLATNGREK